jgi:photosystem II stability/assembly factor-like uncharacterized protein
MKKTLSFLFSIIIFSSLNAQNQESSATESNYFATTKYRLVGPFRGGRATAVCGSIANKQLFYMGSTGGGVWRTLDGGSNWQNISDKYFGGSIGSIALAPNDENTIYVGEGENTMRGNVSEGINGMWKSENAGRSWQNIGLQFARHITRIIVHPKNENIVWAAVTGSIFSSSKERGVYKTTDGGKTWRQVLYSGNPQAGAIELTAEPNNPDVMYASTWNFKRTPFSMESGGPGSAIYKTYDGGETWKNISAAKGLPKDSIWGISHVAISQTNPDKVFAIIEAASGGLFMSTDAGNTWTKQSTDANIRQRAWYFSKIFLNPQNDDEIYACNVEFWRSKNNGASWNSIRTPHGDHHNMWIDPTDGNRMIIADDGGAQISYDAGANWSTYYNQSTAQLYRVSADNAYPYHLLSGQQDNSSVRIQSRTSSGAIYNNNFTATAGGEAGYDVADPLNPDIVYGGEYAGGLRRKDHRTGEIRTINVWPESSIGSGAEVLKYRFQWNFPLFFSPNNPKKLYAAGNCLFSSVDEGVSWQKISPDLTSNDRTKLGSSGGLITKDNTTAEYYCTIFSATESVLEKDLIYTGSDDGLIYITKNGGTNWTNITPTNLPKAIMWNCIETDPHIKGKVYAVGTCYKTNNFEPYIFMSNNYGASWTRITNGINKMHFTRVLRADKERKDLLYCGTEYGMYISYDGGANWKKFQNNLPLVPITDLCIKDNDLIVATQGRSLWILDNLTTVQSYGATAQYGNKNISLLPINNTYYYESYKSENVKNAGENPDAGVVFNYWIENEYKDTKLKLLIMDNANNLIDSFSNTEAKENKKLKTEVGFNKFVWNMAYPAQEDIKDMVLWNGGISNGPQAIPGNYKAELIYNKDTVRQAFKIISNPTYKTTIAQYSDQFNFAMLVKSKYDAVQTTIKDIREIKNQINNYYKLQDAKIDTTIKKLGDSIIKKVTVVEENLYQTKAKSGQDVLNYPIKLNDKISALYNQTLDGHTSSTQGAKDVLEVLSKQADVEIDSFKNILQNEVKLLNKMIKEHKAPIIGVKKQD